jgi:hypothetical protein
MTAYIRQYEHDRVQCFRVQIFSCHNLPALILPISNAQREARAPPREWPVT